MLAYLPRLQADDLLKEHGSDMFAEDLYRVVLQATNDKEAAEQAFANRRKLELKTGVHAAKSAGDGG